MIDPPDFPVDAFPVYVQGVALDPLDGFVLANPVALVLLRPLA